MKYYVVADIHGFYTPLKEVLTKEGFFEDREAHKLIVCGDLFDRGAESCKVQSFICDLMQKDEVILIRGNHEDLVLEFIEHITRWMGPNVIGTHHWSNGTIDSLLQLADISLISAYDYPKEFAKKVMDTPFIREIIPAMKNYYETRNYIFVHGWIPCRVIGKGTQQTDVFMYEDDWRTQDETQWARARWMNGMLAASQSVIEPKKTIVCGHWHCSYGHAVLEGKCSEFDDDADFSPYYGKGIIALDACTAYSGQINCLVIEDEMN